MVELSDPELPFADDGEMMMQIKRSMILATSLMLSAGTAWSEGSMEAKADEPAAAVEVQQTQDKPARVVMARVGESEITVEDFIGFISLNPERVREARGKEGKAAILKIMIANVLLQHAMAKEGLLPKSAGTQEYLAAMNKLGDKYFPTPADPDEETLKTFYESNKDAFGIPASTRISQIQFRFPKGADDAAKAEVKARADAAFSRIKAGEPFSDVARELTENPGAKDTGGDLGFIEKVAWSPWLKNALKDVPVGGYTEVLPSPIGYEIVMITDERPAIVTPFPEAKDRIRDHLKAEAQNKVRDEYVKRLASQTEIQIELDELKDAYPQGIFP